MIILIILIVAIIAGIILSGMMAPVIIASNRKQINEMRKAVDHYNHNLNEGLADPEAAFKETLKRLYTLKKKVWIGDKASVAQAEDIISEFKALN